MYIFFPMYIRTGQQASEGSVKLFDAWSPNKHDWFWNLVWGHEMQVSSCLFYSQGCWNPFQVNDSHKGVNWPFYHPPCTWGVGSNPVSYRLLRVRHQYPHTYEYLTILSHEQTSRGLPQTFPAFTRQSQPIGAGGSQFCSWHFRVMYHIDPYCPLLTWTQCRLWLLLKFPSYPLDFYPSFFSLLQHRSSWGLHPSMGKSLGFTTLNHTFFWSL